MYLRMSGTKGVNQTVPYKYKLNILLLLCNKAIVCTSWIGVKKWIFFSLGLQFRVVLYTTLEEIIEHCRQEGCVYTDDIKSIDLSCQRGIRCMRFWSDKSFNTLKDYAFYPYLFLLLYYDTMNIAQIDEVVLMTFFSVWCAVSRWQNCVGEGTLWHGHPAGEIRAICWTGEAWQSFTFSYR